MQYNDFFDKQRMAQGVPSYPPMPPGAVPGGPAAGYPMARPPRMPAASVDWPNTSPASPPGHAPMLASQHKMHAIPNQQFPPQNTLTDASNGSIKQFARPPMNQPPHPHMHQQQLQQQFHPQQTSAPPPPPPPQQQSVVLPPSETFRINNEARRKQLQQYQKRDEEYQKALNKQHKQYVELAREKKTEIDAFQHDKMMRMQHNPIAVFGKGYLSQQQRDGSDLRGRILYPRDRKRRRQTTDFHFPMKKLAEQASKQDTLVPIRLDFDIDGYKLRDTFTWNLNESLITPEQFAVVLCEDLNLPIAMFKPNIVRAISDQIEDYDLHVASMVTGNDQAEDEEAAAVALKVFNKQTTVNGTHNEGENEDEEEAEKKSNKEQEASQTEQGRKKKAVSDLRMLVKLDITVGNQALIDQFEWDINCRHNSPERFAEVLVNELGLGGEFKTAIAHSIREQVHAYVKYLLLTGYEFDGSTVTDDDIKRSLLPTVRTIMRDLNIADSFTPAVLELTNAEIDKVERDRMREARRKRRQVRSRRGLILPDLEPIKTHRTNTLTLPPLDDGASEDNARGSTPEVTGHYSTRRSAAQKARQNIAAAASSHHYHDDERTTAAPSSLSRMQNAISLNTGNRFSTMADHATKPLPSHMVDRSWLCSNCQCTIQQTSIVRSGPYGEKTLCNACGLYFFRFNKPRPPNYTDSEIRNQPAF